MSRKSAPARPPAGKRAPAPTPKNPRPPRRGRSRVSVVALVLLVAVAGLVVASLRTVAPGERAFRVSRGGAVTRLAPGRVFVPPILARLVRLPADPLRVEGSEPLRSREGAELVTPWAVEASIPDAALARLLASGDDPEALLREAARAAVTTWAAGATGDGLVLGEG